MKNWLHLVKYFLIKDIKVRYAGSGLGLFWALLLPMFQILLYWFVFSTVMRIRPYSNEHVPYIFFLISTFFFWLSVLEGIIRSGSVIIENGELVKKVSFPQMILPVAITLSGYLQNLIGVIFFLLIFTVSGMAHTGMFLIIPVLALQLIFSIGAGILISALVPYVRDLQQVMGYILQGMFFLSPILYSLEAIPEKVRGFAYLNPVTVYIESYHIIIFERSFPELWQVGLMMFISLSFLAAGITVFNKLKEGFADIL
jgi:ABC-type polysaccharide/polyol phosphate export permease